MNGDGDGRVMTDGIGDGDGAKYSVLRGNFSQCVTRQSAPSPSAVVEVTSASRHSSACRTQGRPSTGRD